MDALPIMIALARLMENDTTETKDFERLRAKSDKAKQIGDDWLNHNYSRAKRTPESNEASYDRRHRERGQEA